MPTIIASLFLSLIFFQSADKEKKTDREYDELNGPVRLVRIETERQNKERSLDKIVLYDINGREREEMTFNKDCVMGRYVFSYDDKDNRTESIFWGQGIVTGKPDNSQAVGSPLIYKRTFKLDDSGRRTENYEYDSNGKLYAKWFHKYDGQGRVKETTTAYNDSTQAQCEFKYNDKGLSSEENCKRQYSTEKTTYTYEYDANGYWIKRIASSTTKLYDGSQRENQVITYREIKLYTSKLARPEDTADSIDDMKLVPCPPMVIRKSGGVLQGSATKRVAPNYPRAAQAAGIGGTVVVEVMVNEAGKVISVKPISGPSELRAASEEAARGWEFHPTTLSRIPVKVIGTITFNFNL